MKFYIREEDYSLHQPHGNNSNTLSGLNGYTAVAAYKQWLFSCLREFGSIIPFNADASANKLKSMLDKPGAIHVAVNILLGGKHIALVPRRYLWLTLGSLLLPEYIFYNLKVLPSAQVNLVSTNFQLERMRHYFGKLVPETKVFSNKIAIDYYTPPDRRERFLARKRQGIKENQVHIVYAGRWIVTKGICQLIRMLDLWRLPDNVVFTIAGNIEEDCRLVYSSANHKTFPIFFNDEVLRNKGRYNLRFQQTKDQQGLRELFWSADLFINLSIQPDEDFGVTPRQAMSCGVPLLSTNFCGLNPVANSMPWQGVDTYPTLYGSRFSLKQCRSLLGQAIDKRHLLSDQQCRSFITHECDPNTLKNNLKQAVDYLKDRPTEKTLKLHDIQSRIRKQLFSRVGSRLLKHFLEARQELPSGAYAYGDAPAHYGFAIAQGIYSAQSAAPIVEKNSRWRAFFRISFFDHEQALIEFGYPGLRIKRYARKEWVSLLACRHRIEPNEFLAIPCDKRQIAIVQELVDLGYLVPEG